jgi:hemoglobin
MTPQIISDAHARTLATYWLDQHDAEAPLTVLAQTGAIAEETAGGLERDLQRLEQATAGQHQVATVAQTQLRALLGYVRSRGPRGPIAGWAELPHVDPSSQGPPPARRQTGRHRPSHGTPNRSLYERIGGDTAIAEAVETFYRTVLADPALAPYFEGVDVERVKAHQFAFIRAASGGPDVHVERPLRRAHHHLAIPNEHFDRAIDHLAASLAGVCTDLRAVGAVTARLARLRDEIVSAG